MAEAGDNIVFLHELQPGPASRSYGVQVARLAGMPPSLIRHARAALDTLETQQKQGDDQIDLFADMGASTSQGAGLPDVDVLLEQVSSTPADNLHTTSPAESATLSLLASIDPDQLTPREALDALYKLKSVITS